MQIHYSLLYNVVVICWQEKGMPILSWKKINVWKIHADLISVLVVLFERNPSSDSKIIYLVIN